MAMDQQTALERQQALYREKNAHLRQYLEPVEPYEFYREIFPEGSFERKGHFEDSKGNGIALVVPCLLYTSPSEVKSGAGERRCTGD